MIAPTRPVLLLSLAVMLGMAANFLFGPSPAAVVPVVADDSPWTEVGMRTPDLAQSDPRWEARAPWGRPPPPPTPQAEPPPPPPIPVGIVGAGRAQQAIFMVSGAGELRLPAGGALPDGGRVLEVSAMTVSWVDGAGQKHQRRMFVDPLQLSDADQVR